MLSIHRWTVIGGFGTTILLVALVFLRIGGGGDKPVTLPSP